MYRDKTMGIINNVLSTIGLSDNSFGIAFGGGGARGFSHVGVIFALEKFGIRPTIISGVSAGAIAAVLYGAGLSPKEMLECFSDYSRLKDFADWTVPKEGLMKLSRFQKLLEEWLPVKNIEDLKTPTVVCATDFDNGKSVGFTKGEISPRVVASCSIPLVFSPVKINGINYVDGGVLRNLPAWAIRNHCKTLVGSNCSPLDRAYSYKKSILNIGIRTFQLMAKSNIRQDLDLCDIVIQNESLSRVKTFDITEMNKIMVKGYDSACKVFEAYFS